MSDSTVAKNKNCSVVLFIVTLYPNSRTIQKNLVLIFHDEFMVMGHDVCITEEELWLFYCN